MGSAVVRFGTEEIATPVVLGKPGDSALLGAITLEAFGLALDPFQRKLYRATSHNSALVLVGPIFFMSGAL